MRGRRHSARLLGNNSHLRRDLVRFRYVEPMLLIAVLTISSGASSVPAPEDALAFHTQFEGTLVSMDSPFDRRTSCRYMR